MAVSMIPLADRLWSRVDMSGGPNACWPWTGYVNGRGYGVLTDHRRSRVVHRLAYEIANGPIPDALCACHTCDNRICCNPAHVYAGTNAQNVADREARGRGGDHRGESNGAAKVDADMVRAIRKSTEPTMKICATFGLARTQVRYIIRRKSWAHVLDE